MMASSGSFSGSIRDGHYKLRVDWSQSKNVSANTSTVTCKLYLVNDWSLNISGRSDNKCTIDGTALTYASPASVHCVADTCLYWTEVLSVFFPPQLE